VMGVSLLDLGWGSVSCKERVWPCDLVGVRCLLTEREDAYGLRLSYQCQS
jgi:hypothetical protein